MSRSMFALAVLSLPALALEAQSTAEWRETARKAEAEYRALRDSMLQGDSTVQEVARKGDLVLGASNDLRTVSLAAFARLVQVRDRWFGGRSPSPHGFRIVIREYPSDDGRQHATRMVVLSGLPDSGMAIRIDRMARSSEVGDVLLDLYGEMMIGSLPPAIREWLGLLPPLSMSERERKHLVMYAVTTGTGAAQRACLSGLPSDCLYALGLAGPSRSEPGRRYGEFLRSDVLLTALGLRRDGWDRLRTAGAEEPIAALAEAAGVSADSLIHYWLANTLATRPTEGPLGVTVGLSTIGWIALLLAGAMLGGRSRWV